MIGVEPASSAVLSGQRRSAPDPGDRRRLRAAGARSPRGQQDPDGDRRRRDRHRPGPCPPLRVLAGPLGGRGAQRRDPDRRAAGVKGKRIAVIVPDSGEALRQPPVLPTALRAGSAVTLAFMEMAGPGLARARRGASSVICARAWARSRGAGRQHVRDPRDLARRRSAAGAPDQQRPAAARVPLLPRLLATSRGR